MSCLVLSLRKAIVMKRVLPFLVLTCLWLPSVEAQKKKAEPPVVRAWCQHEDALYKDNADKVLETSAYFDAVNFARKFKGKSLHSVEPAESSLPSAPSSG